MLFISYRIFLQKKLIIFYCGFSCGYATDRNFHLSKIPEMMFCFQMFEIIFVKCMNSLLEKLMELIKYDWIPEGGFHFVPQGPRGSQGFQGSTRKGVKGLDQVLKSQQTITSRKSKIINNFYVHHADLAFLVYVNFLFYISS